jgi:hypothetical protein
MLKLLLVIALFRSPTWVLFALAVGCVLLWIVSVIDWRTALAIPGFVLVAVGIALFRGWQGAEMETTGILCVGIGVALFFPAASSGARRERAEREARKRAEAERVRPIGPPWSNAVLALSEVVSLFALPIAGAMLDEHFGLGPHHNADIFHDAPLAGAGVALGLIAALGLPLWAAVRERKRIRGLPKGLIGQTGEGIYVYDLNRSSEPTAKEGP